MTNEQKSDFIDWLKTDTDFIYDMVDTYLNNPDYNLRLIISDLLDSWEQSVVDNRERQYYDNETGGLL